MPVDSNRKLWSSNVYLEREAFPILIMCSNDENVKLLLHLMLYIFNFTDQCPMQASEALVDLKRP